MKVEEDDKRLDFLFCEYDRGRSTKKMMPAKGKRRETEEGELDADYLNFKVVFP